MKTNKVIRLVSGCLLVVAMMAIFWACNKESISEPSGSDVLTSDVEINKVIQNYFDRKNDLVIGDATQEEKNKFLEITSNSKNARKIINEQSESSDLYEEDVNKTNIISVETKFKVDSLKSSGFKKEILVSVINSIHTDAQSIYTNEFIVTEEALVYKIDLVVSGVHLLIDSEELVNKIGDSNYKNSLIKTLPENAKNNTSNARIQGVYNRASSVKWALDNASYYNGCGLWFWANGGDCTNFVSTALNFGGWKSDAIWWMKVCGTIGGASYAWGGAHPFRNYLLSSNRVLSQSSSIQSLQRGDVICCEWHGDASFDHTVIVTDKDSKGNLYLSYHTSNTRNISYKDFMERVKSQRGKYPTLNPFRLKDSY